MQEHKNYHTKTKAELIAEIEQLKALKKKRMDMVMELMQAHQAHNDQQKERFRHYILFECEQELKSVYTA